MGSRDGPEEKEKEMIPQTQMWQLTKGIRGKVRISLYKKIKKTNLKNEDGTGLEELLHLSLSVQPRKGVEGSHHSEWNKSRTSHRDIKAQNTHLQGNDQVIYALIHCISPEHNSVIFLMLQ